MAEGPMETERIALSQRERDRLKVLHEVQQKQLTQVAAAERSGSQNRKKWLRGLDSNQDNQLQRLACYQLHYPGIGKKKCSRPFPHLLFPPTAYFGLQAGR